MSEQPAAFAGLPDWVKQLPDRTRFILALTIGSLLIGAISAYVFISFRNQIQRDVELTLTVIAEQKREQIEHRIQRHRIDAESYFTGTAQIPMLLDRYFQSGHLDSEALRLMQDRMTEVAEAMGVSGMAVLDTRGHPIMVVGTVQPRRDAALSEEVARRRLIKLLDLSFNLDGTPELGQLSPISVRGAEPIGVVQLAWNAEQTLFPLVKDWPIPTQTADTFLVRIEGDVLRFLSPLRDAPGSELRRTLPLPTEPPLSERLAQRQRGLLRDAVDAREIAVLAYATPVDGTPWLMVAQIDQREAYARVWQTAWITALVGAAALLIIHGSGYLLWRQTAARRMGEQRLAGLIEQGLTGYAEVDLDTRLTRVNDRYCAIVGRARTDLIGHRLSEFTPPEDWALNQAIFERLRQGEIQSELFEKRYQRRDGGLTYAQVAIALLRDGAGRPRGYLALVADLTQRVEAEIALNEQSDTLRRLNDEQRAIHDAATVGIALARDRVIQRCNRTMERIFSYRPGELIDQNTRVLYADEAIHQPRSTLDVRTPRAGLLSRRDRDDSQGRQPGLDPRLDRADRSLGPDQRTRRNLRRHHRRARRARACSGAQCGTRAQGGRTDRRGRSRQRRLTIRERRVESARDDG